jgi:ABC-type transporter MlaC component
MMKKVLFIGILMVLLNSCNNEEGKMFSAPENTIITYYKAMENEDEKLLKKCFMEPKYADKAFGKVWVTFNIKSVREISPSDVEEFEREIKEQWDNEEYQGMYRYFLKNRYAYEQIGDVRVIVTVELQRTGPVNFHYLLRKINNQWKIVVNPH